MAELVYVLCALTSLSCAGLLLRSYFKTRIRFLLWSGLGFVGFSVNNAFLSLDLIYYPSLDLSLWRILPAFIGLIIMIFGLMWDTVS